VLRIRAPRGRAHGEGQARGQAQDARGEPPGVQPTCSIVRRNAVTRGLIRLRNSVRGRRGTSILAGQSRTACSGVVVGGRIELPIFRSLGGRSLDRIFPT